MANNYSTEDILKGVLVFCGERFDGTSPYTSLALKFINNVYKNLLAGANEFNPEIGDAWSWARQTSTFILPGYYDSGTVTMTANSPNGVFSSAPTISLQGYDFQVQNQNTKNWYSITSHVAGATAFTLNADYIDTAGSGLSFRAARLIWDLGAGILRLIEPLRINVNRVLEYGEKYQDQGRIYGLTTSDFWKNWPIYQVENDIPSKFTTISMSESEWIIRFNKYVTNQIKVDFDYIPIPTELTNDSNSIPLVPFAYRDYLEMGASFYLASVKNDKEKAELSFNIAKAKLQAMHLAEEKMNKQLSVIFGQIVPRRDMDGRPYWLYWR